MDSGLLVTNYAQEQNLHENIIVLSELIVKKRLVGLDPYGLLAAALLDYGIACPYVVDVPSVDVVGVSSVVLVDAVCVASSD